MSDSLLPVKTGSFHLSETTRHIMPHCMICPSDSLQISRDDTLKGLEKENLESGFGKHLILTAA